MNARTPAAVVLAAHTAHERYVYTSLTKIGLAIPTREALPGPAVIVIGEVAKLGEIACAKL